MGRAPGEGGIVHVHDTSAYGTQWRSTAGKSGPGPQKKLGTTERQYSGGDELQLVEGMVLSRSGRRFPTGLTQTWQRRQPRYLTHGGGRNPHVLKPRRNQARPA
ncbi:hypothetical protein [Streptomyces sp. NBC_01618]|uniref:hypothetical protein n=1 Tax=Streptomyces sp. NBC_01618 TaxID=2975900 RepID=UPI00386B66CE|nr:hypothetical protein OH735_14045 [Streptomyces sp. NBC_01618]